MLRRSRNAGRPASAGLGATVGCGAAGFGAEGAWVGRAAGARVARCVGNGACCRNGRMVSDGAWVVAFRRSAGPSAANPSVGRRWSAAVGRQSSAGASSERRP